MRSDSGLDLFSLAREDGTPPSSLRALTWPVLFTPVAALGMLLGGWAGISGDVRSFAAAAGASAVAGLMYLFVQRRWKPVRPRLGNAMLSEGDASQGRDWSPLERKVARKALSEHVRADTDPESRKYQLKDLLWPIYGGFLLASTENGLETASYGLGLLAVILAVLGARSGYRHAVLRPLLARVSKRQLALLEGGGDVTLPAEEAEARDPQVAFSEELRARRPQVVKVG